MSKYEGLECPVCKKIFEDGDDIVTCPDCGTPHHRECYNMIGKCVNSGLHNSGYEFVTKKETQDASTENANAGEYYTPSATNDESQSKASPSAIPTINSVEDIDKEYGRNNETIGGNDITEVAATIRINIPRFINVFRKMEKTGKKASWNWGAFAFGSLYFLFRKMYKQGLAITSVLVALIVGGDALMYRLAPEYVKAVSEMANQYVQGKAIDPAKMITSDYNKAAMVAYIMLGVILIIKVICGLFADYTYKKSIDEIIKRVNDQLEDNMSFSINPMMGQSNSLSQDQMKKMYLARRGGVSLFAPTMALFLVYTLISFIQEEIC